MASNVRVWHGSHGKAYCAVLDKPIAFQARPRPCFVFSLDDCPVALTVERNMGSRKRFSRELCSGQGAALKSWKLHRMQPSNPRKAAHVLIVSVDPEYVTISPVDQLSAQLGAGTWPMTTSDGQYDTLKVVRSTASEILNLQSSAEEVLRMIFRSRHSLSTTLPSCNRSKLSILDYRIRRAITIISENMDEEINCASIANATGLSRPHFFRVLKEQTGLTPRTFLNALRLDRAEDCLSASDIPIQDISLDLGFSAPSNFTRFFKNHIGISPVEYRRHSTSLYTAKNSAAPETAYAQFPGYAHSSADEWA